MYNSHSETLDYFIEIKHITPCVHINSYVQHLFYTTFQLSNHNFSSTFSNVVFVFSSPPFFIIRVRLRLTDVGWIFNRIANC